MRPPTSFRFCAALTFALIAHAPLAAAAEVQGTVTGPSGSVVAGAVVRLKAGDGKEETARTNAAGRFTFPTLAPGEYVMVVVTAAGLGERARSVSVNEAAGEAVEIVLPAAGFADQVTVVAARLVESPDAMKRIPGSVDVLEQAVLETSRVFTLNEALGKVAGLRVRDEEGFGLRPNVGIRGLNPTRSTKVLLLEDGLPFTYAPYGDNASYYHPPVERFEAIEVLKGSSQIAYGPVTLGGVLNYITPAPPIRPGGSLSLTGGNRDYMNGHARYGGTWGRTGLLFDYLRKQGDGARENIHSELDDVSAKALFTLSSRQTLTLKANYYGEDSNVTYSGLRQAEFEADPRQNPFQNDFFYGDRLGGSARHSLVFGTDALLVTQGYVSHFKRNWWRQSSNSGQRPNDSGDPLCGGMANLLTTCGNEGRLREYLQWGVEPRLRLSRHIFGLAAETDMGVRAHFETQERIQQNGATPTARQGSVVEDNLRQNEAYSAFLQTRFALGELSLTPGVRVEHVHYHRTNNLASGGAGIGGRTHLTQLVPGLGAAWNPGPRLTVFAGAHRGFAPPRTEDVISNTTGGVIDLDPELSWNVEAGVRSQPRDGVRLDATAFRMDYENQIVPASLAGGVGATLTNGGETLHQGVEASLRLDGGTLLRSTHNPYLRVAATWLPTARFTGLRSSSVSGFGSVNVSGNRLPYAPERSVTATVGYSHAGFDGMVEAVHVSDQFADDLNTVDPTPDGQRGLIPAYTLWNATVNHALPRWRTTVFVTVKNLLDETVIVDRARGILPNSPRLVQAGFKLAF